MSGLNPYIEQIEIQTPLHSSQFTFDPQGKTVNILTGEILEEKDWLLGSLLQLALNNDIGLDDNLGRVSTRPTCHVIKSASEFCAMATEDEEDMLDLTKASRRNPYWPDSSFLTPRTTLLPKSTTGTVTGKRILQN